MSRLSQDSITQIHQAGIVLGLDKHREALLAGLDRAFVASLSRSDTSTAQLLSDLHALNESPVLQDGSRPLVHWLKSAQAIASSRPEAKILADILELVDPRRDEHLPRIGQPRYRASAPSSDAVMFLDIQHRHNPPPEYAYFYADDCLVKAFANTEFILDVYCGNNGEHDALVGEFVCRTLHHERLLGKRVLIQTKAKGFFEPPELNFRPISKSLAEVNILGSRVLRIRGRGIETFRVKLDNHTEPGLYELQFCAKAIHAGRRTALVSDVFTLLVDGGGEDLARLVVTGRHYDDPVVRVLELSEADWRRITAPSVQPVARYLGPTISQAFKTAFEELPQPTVWSISEEFGVPQLDGAEIFAGTAPSHILTLPGTINEPLHWTRERIERRRQLFGWLAHEAPSQTRYDKE